MIKTHPMARFANQLVISILLFFFTVYSNTIFAQPGKQVEHGNFPGFRNSLAANAGVGIFCGHIGAGVGLEYQRFIDRAEICLLI